MTHDEIIALVQAHKEGKTLQAFDGPDRHRKWVDIKTGSISEILRVFPFGLRIKPESIAPKEIWVNVYAGDLIAYETRERAVGSHSSDRIACVKYILAEDQE